MENKSIYENENLGFQSEEYGLNEFKADIDYSQDIDYKLYDVIEELKLDINDGEYKGSKGHKDDCWEYGKKRCCKHHNPCDDHHHDWDCDKHHHDCDKHHHDCDCHKHHDDCHKPSHECDCDKYHRDCDCEYDKHRECWDCGKPHHDCDCHKPHCDDKDFDWEEKHHYPCLEITKKFDRTCAIPGQQVTVTIKVRNKGKYTLRNLVITDDLPPQLTFVPGSLEINCRKVHSDSTTFEPITLCSLKPCQEVLITFRVTVGPFVGETVNNEACVKFSYFISGCCSREVWASECSDPALLNIVAALCNITKEVRLESACDEAELGDILVYTIRASSNCQIRIDEFILRDNLSPSLRCLEVREGQNTFNCGDLATGINLGPIEPGETKVVTIRAKIIGLGDCGIIKNRARGTSIIDGQEFTCKSNEVFTKVNFKDCGCFQIEDCVRLSCKEGPAIGLIKSCADVEILDIKDLSHCDGDRKIKVSAVLNTSYVFDKGYCREGKVCSKKCFSFIFKLPKGIDLKCKDLLKILCVKDICSKIVCGFTIESKIKLIFCVKMKDKHK